MEPRVTNREGTPAAGRSGKHRLRGAFSRVFHVYRRLWFRVLAVGFPFKALLEVSNLAYPDPSLVPAIIVYCAFLVPVTFMVHLDHRLEATQMPVAVIMIIFISSGAISLAFASTLELALFPPLDFLQNLFVGPIEETAKLSLWNERRKAGRAVFNGRVLGAFVLAISCISRGAGYWHGSPSR